MHIDVKRLHDFVGHLTEAVTDVEKQDAWLSVYLGDAQQIPRVYTSRRHVHPVRWWDENNGLIMPDVFGVDDRIVFSGRRYVEERPAAQNGIEIVSEYTIAYRDPRSGHYAAVMLETYDPDGGGPPVRTSERIAEFLGIRSAHQYPQVILTDRLLTAGDFYASALAVVTDVSDNLLKRLAHNPDDIHGISPRQFEKVVARLLRDMGYEVWLTPEQKDGGKDIIALERRDIGNVITLVECKKWRPDRPIPVEIVRGVYGVLSQERASTALLVTTSRYTSAARAFRDTVRYQLELRDIGDLANWLAKYA